MITVSSMLLLQYPFLLLLLVVVPLQLKKKHLLT
jgi:hypothetical protein